MYRPHDAVEAKGKADPVEVWEAIEARGRVGGLVEDPSSPLVGRDNERALLLGAFARVRVDRSPQLVTLVGVPGIGKSRLVGELGRAVEEDEEIITWRYGRCLPYGDGVIVLGARRDREGAGRDPRERRRRCDSGEARYRRRRSRAEPWSVPGSSRASSRSSGWCRRTSGSATGGPELYAGWRIFLESLAERRPLVLVIDDLHWADDGFLDFVDGLVDLVEGVPLLVVASARPELLERRPDWGGGKRNALDGLARPAPRGRDGSPRGVASRTRSGRRGAPGDRRRAIGRQPVVRRGVRPDADVRR